MFKSRSTKIFVILMMVTWITCIQNCHGKIPNKIYGGRPANFEAEFPFVVSLQFRESHYCGASILTEYFIITAANCVLLETSPMVYVSNINVHMIFERENYNEEVIYSVSYILPHEKYDTRKSSIHDLALLKLETPILSHTDEINAVLPTSYVRGTMSLGTVGWKNSGNLIFLIMTVENENTCRYIYSNFNFRRIIQKCATTLYESSGFSQGDGGCPVVRGKNIHGIISLYFPQKPRNIIFTDIYSHVNWIVSTMLIYNSR